MQTYTGTKIITARPMTCGEFADYIGSKSEMEGPSQEDIFGNDWVVVDAIAKPETA